MGPNRDPSPVNVFSTTALAPVAALIVSGFLVAPDQPGAKAMFYDPSDLGASPAAAGARLRPISLRRPFVHCGIEYWVESQSGVPMTLESASRIAGRYTLHIRSNIGEGFLAVFEVNGKQRELTPRMDPRWSGFIMDGEFALPEAFEFTHDETAEHLAITWARSQTELARNAATALDRVHALSKMPIVRESDDSTPGEIGTYVVNRVSAGLGVEIVFRTR